MSKLADKQVFPRVPDGPYGMTLREYYIGQALQGELANHSDSFVFKDADHRKYFAQRVLSAADAVLELMEQEPKP